MLISKSMRVFVTLFNERNLKDAADRLSLTVPPVSRMIKNTEEWFGEKLFIFEKNKAIPTLAAEVLYDKLLPHYVSLNEICAPKRNKFFTISSPMASSLFFLGLLDAICKGSNNHPIIRFSDHLQNDDDMFFSFTQVRNPVNFIEFKFNVPYEIICNLPFRNNWKGLDLFIDRYLLSSEEFTNSLALFRSDGYLGSTKRVDSTYLQEKSFREGNCLIFRSKAFESDLNSFSIYSFPIIIFVYKNNLTKSDLAQSMINELKKFLVEL
jgi:hypothetical protein